MNTEQAYKTIKKFITRERTMRDHYLRGTKRTSGMEEADRALEALAVLREAVAVEPEPEQTRLFDA